MNSEGEFQNSEAIHWLEIYDADVVYSYTSLSYKTVQLIEKFNSPASLKEHDFGRDDHTVLFPNISYSFSPISSISTIHSPSLFIGLFRTNQSENIKIITQHDPSESDRFITDNFGNQISHSNVLHEVPGLFQTVCLTPEGIPTTHSVGTERVSSIQDVLNRLEKREVYPVSRLAAIHCDDMSIINSSRLNSRFNIVIGETVQDRILFWGLRHHYNQSNSCLGCMIFAPHELNDDLARALGGYLNNNNFTGNGNQHASLRSHSLSATELEKFKEMIQPHTYNTINVFGDYMRDAIPNDVERPYIHSFDADSHQIQISENISSSKIERPRHLVYIPSKYSSHALGEWCVEASIDRHNNLSRYSNIVDSWLLPRRSYISRVFGKSCTRISRSKLPVFKLGEVPTPFNNLSPNKFATLDISLPEDISVISNLVKGKGSYDVNDERHILLTSNVDYINVSSPGKNLNGVISKFDSLIDASSYLTNKSWREVFAKYKENSSMSDGIFKTGQLFGAIPRGEKIAETIKNSLSLKTKKDASQYWTACFKDALNELIERDVFFPVYTWSCKYCGHQNCRTIELLKRVNQCDICEKKHSVLIDDHFKWKYRLNKFVHNTLHENDGLPVLWGLSFLQQRSGADSFYYLPQTNIHYDKQRNNEIDLIGVMDGIFFIGEAKRSADYFLIDDREKNKFIDVVNEIFPDLAVLVFLQYSEDDSNDVSIGRQIEQFKKDFHERMDSDVQLDILVADRDSNFSDYGTDFGGIGENVLMLLEKLEGR
jgi:hypothetical protein